MVNGDASTVALVSQNLYWWNLFGQRNGANFFSVFRAAGPFDIMLLQECDDVAHIVRGLGVEDCFAYDRGTHAVSVAWNSERFEKLSSGSRDVGEDRAEQYYGEPFCAL